MQNYNQVYFKTEFNFLLKNYKDKLPHSWIFYGPKGTGKREFLINFVKEIYKDKDDYKQFLYEINSLQNIALIDDVRNLINQGHLTNSSSNKYKTFLIVNNFELLNINSSTALLKTIEEPPNNTIIVLITHNLKLIPKTIKSRCIRLRLSPYDSWVFSKKKTNENEIENFKICNGQPEIFHILNSDDGNLIKSEIKRILRKNKFEFLDCENLYSKISKDFDSLFPILTNTIYFLLKEKFKRKELDLNKKNIIINYLEFLKNKFNKNFLLEKKRVLHLIISEYFYLGLNR